MQAVIYRCKTRTCAKEERVETDTNDQAGLPYGWVELAVTGPPLGGFLGRVTLCGDCGAPVVQLFDEAAGEEQR